MREGDENGNDVPRLEPKRDILHIPSNEAAAPGSNVLPVDFRAKRPSGAVRNTYRLEKDPVNLQNIADAKGAREVFLKQAEVYPIVSEYLYQNTEISRTILKAKNIQPYKVWIRKPEGGPVLVSENEGVYEPLAKVFTLPGCEDESKVKQALRDWLQEGFKHVKSMEVHLKEGTGGGLYIQWQKN